MYRFYENRILYYYFKQEDSSSKKNRNRFLCLLHDYFPQQTQNFFHNNLVKNKSSIYTKNRVKSTQSQKVKTTHSLTKGKSRHISTALITTRSVVLESTFSNVFFRVLKFEITQWYCFSIYMNHYHMISNTERASHHHHKPLCLITCSLIHSLMRRTRGSVFERFERFEPYPTIESVSHNMQT